MVRRRVKAIFELVLGVFVLRFVLRTRKFVAEHADEIDEDGPAPLSPKGVAIGAAMSLVTTWLSDRDVLEVRTNRRRRILFELVRGGQSRVFSRFASTSESFEVSYGLGSVCGLVVYRLWYGLLNPLPGPESRTREPTTE
ncbi:hypothetical protein [Halococcus hamelinensis]|uniref:DUF8097 domain-containing protein n=1 Tax=Halococcus hamelinensis 100A6 TaxID=1132509 RepID=M0LZH7_9EURY|nr:hypothetical protein [Halococcus hamelinensis]EMA38558.1 hypothetical protein C447_09187 [Halococcus hamelinensis 100A6]